MKREIVLRFLAEPIHINFGGKVHGGTVMKWIDQAAYVCATKWSGYYCVTAHISNMKFYRPVHIGNIVEAHAKIIYTGKTSMHILVIIKSSSIENKQLKCNTKCIITFVALDKNGKKVAVPKWKPKTKKDKHLEQYAKKLINLSKKTEL